MRCFVGPRDCVAYPNSDYSLYDSSSISREGFARTCPISPGLLDPGVAGLQRAALTFCATPTHLPARWSSRGDPPAGQGGRGHLVVDEAYIDFASATDPSAIPPSSGGRTSSYCGRSPSRSRWPPAHRLAFAAKPIIAGMMKSRIRTTSIASVHVAATAALRICRGCGKNVRRIQRTGQAGVGLVDMASSLRLRNELPCWRAARHRRQGDPAGTDEKKS